MKQDDLQPEIAIGSLTCAKTDGTISFSMKFTNTIDENVVIYEVQVYATLPEGDTGPEQTQNVGVELATGEACDGTFAVYKAEGLPDDNTYYIDIIYEDEQGDSFVEQYSTAIKAGADGPLTVTPPVFLERYDL